ncbi:MAG: hypothetical protein HYU77_13190 [Betaproteobacteria bacterium]|nr:hypothetical protein [Betaproteobacteria bacterium]
MIPARWLFPGVALATALLCGARIGVAQTTHLPAGGPADDHPLVVESKKRWQQSPHGTMLARILPPSVVSRELPDAGSPGAELLVKYCVQCHNLPSPAMHTREKWPSIVQRMVWRMEGRGNIGDLMKEMMAEVKAPTAKEQKTLVAYLKKHSQKAINPRKYPDLASPEGKVFSIACSQCHTLPDPRRHTAAEWPPVVERMKKHMTWTNRVIGRAREAERELTLQDILSFLKRNSRLN